MLGRRFKGLAGADGAAVAGALFDASDGDGSGDIDIEEFVLGLVKCMRGPVPVKIQLVFQAVAAVAGSSGQGKQQRVSRRRTTAHVRCMH